MSDDGYLYYSEMQFRANWRLLMKRRPSVNLREALYARWFRPRRTGFFGVATAKEDARRHILWRRSPDA